MIETTKQKVYLLYDCDEWETYASMQVNQPIAVAFNKNELIPMLLRDLKEESKDFSEKNKALYKSLKKKILTLKTKKFLKKFLTRTIIQKLIIDL